MGVSSLEVPKEESVIRAWPSLLPCVKMNQVSWTGAMALLTSTCCSSKQCEFVSQHLCPAV